VAFKMHNGIRSVMFSIQTEHLLCKMRDKNAFQDLCLRRRRNSGLAPNAMYKVMMSPKEAAI